MHFWTLLVKATQTITYTIRLYNNIVCNTASNWLWPIHSIRMHTIIDKMIRYSQNSMLSSEYGQYKWETPDNVSNDNQLTQIIIIIIITLFESQIILAEHECCTNWGDCKSNKSNQIKCWFLRRGENRSSRRKTSRSRVENQQTQPTYDAGSGNRTRDTLVEGERSHHYTNPAPNQEISMLTYETTE